jgi:hypothetical protein
MLPMEQMVLILSEDQIPLNPLTTNRSEAKIPTEALGGHKATKHKVTKAQANRFLLCVLCVCFEHSVVKFFYFDFLIFSINTSKR